MSTSKTQQQQDYIDARAYIRLQLGESVARAASHIRSKRAATLRAGIEEVRAEFVTEHGEERVAAFFECVELWLNDRNNTVAAAALRAYIQTDVVNQPVLLVEDDDLLEDDIDADASSISGTQHCTERHTQIHDVDPLAERPSALSNAEALGTARAVPSDRAKRVNGVDRVDRGGRDSPLPKLPTRAPSPNWRLSDTMPAKHSYRSFR